MCVCVCVRVYIYTYMCVYVCVCVLNAFISVTFNDVIKFSKHYKQKILLLLLISCEPL